MDSLIYRGLSVFLLAVDPRDVQKQVRKRMERMEKKISGLPTDIDAQLKFFIKHIKRQVDILANKKPILKQFSSVQWRKEFCKNLCQLSKERQLRVLVKIQFLVVWNLPDDEMSEEDRKRVQLRKQEEYYTRSMSKGKSPKRRPAFDDYIPPKLPHRPTDIFNVLIYALYNIIKESGLSSPYRLTIDVLQNFCGLTYDEDTLRRIVLKTDKTNAKK